MDFKKKTSPSVIDETLWRESEKQVSVKDELEVSCALSYFEEQRDPTGKIKKKSKEDYKHLMKIYWPYYLIPLDEEDTALGIDGMGLEKLEIFKDLTITEAQIKKELGDLEDDALFEGLMNLQAIYGKLGNKEPLDGLLSTEFTKVLIEISKFSGENGYMGVPIPPLVNSNRATEIYEKVNSYDDTVSTLKQDIDSRNDLISEMLNKKKEQITKEIQDLKQDYDQKISNLTPTIEANKQKNEADRKEDINHLKEERQKEITQTMNLIKESFKPIEGKVSFLNDLWEKDKNNVLNISDADQLVTEINGSISRFKTRINEFDTELSNINQEINKISERFAQIRQKYDGEENIVNQKYNKLNQEEDAKITALENEKDSKIQARKNVQDRIEKENNRLLHLSNSFKDKLDESISMLDTYIASDVALSEPILLNIPIWYTYVIHSKGGSRHIILPPVLLPRLLPKKINDDGLGQSDIPVKIYNGVFLEKIRDMFEEFLIHDSKAKVKMEEEIGEQDYFKVKQIRNHFIDGLDMLEGRELISGKNKEQIQTNVLDVFKFSE